jgi:capsular polysaccharide biosynthesis protein
MAAIPTKVIVAMIMAIPIAWFIITLSLTFFYIRRPLQKNFNIVVHITTATGNSDAIHPSVYGNRQSHASYRMENKIDMEGLCLVGKLSCCVKK